LINPNTQALQLAHAIGACRRAATAGGNGIRVLEVEALLLIAGGCDAIGDINEATGGSRANTARSLRFLSGRDAPIGSASGGGGGIRVSPFRLIEYRKHPHRRGHQYRLTPEGHALLSPCLQIQKLPDWS
jgi:DNA-binding MarR family transcriptional regulator